MKNLYARLTQAPLNAPIIYSTGIAGKPSLLPGTPAGYPLSKNKKSVLLPLLASVLIMLLLSLTSKAQTVPFNENWTVLSNEAGVEGFIIDHAGNFYTLVRRGEITYLAKRPAGGTLDTTWLRIDSAGKMYDLKLNNAGNTIYYKSNKFLFSANTDSCYIGRVTNINGTPVNDSRWTFVSNVSIPADGNTASQMASFASWVLDKNDNIFLAWMNKIIKILPTGVVNSNWCTVMPAGNSSRRVDVMTIDTAGNLYANRRLKNGPGEIYSNYVTKITTTGVADTLWANFDPQNLGNTLASQRLQVLEYGNNAIYSYVYSPAAGAKTKFKKADISTGLVTTFDSTSLSNFAPPLGFTYNKNKGEFYFSSFQDTSLYKISNTDAITKQFTFSHRFSPAGSSQPVRLGLNDDICVHLRKDTVIFFPIFSVSTTDYFAFNATVFNVSFNQTQPTCANSNDGGLRAIPSGTCGTGYQYLWTPGGASTDSISNLAPGTYSVRVVCGTDTVNKSITLTASTVVAAPTASNQSLCYGATVADLAATVASGNTIKWYATATGGTALANSTALVNGNKYYASQVTAANCESDTRAADSVSIKGLLNPTPDTAFCNSNSTVFIPLGGGTGNSYSWTATQNGTGVPANGTTSPVFFTASNAGNSVKTDTVFVASNYTIPMSYGIMDGTYNFADTAGSNYLAPFTAFSGSVPTPDFPNRYGMNGSYLVSDSLPIGFSFNFYGTSYTKFFIVKPGQILFDLGSFSFSNPTGIPTTNIYGQSRGWQFDANSKIAYKVSGNAPNRKLVVTYINFKKPADFNNGNLSGTYTADPVAGIGSFQIVLNETTNTIESLKQSVPSLTQNIVSLAGGGTTSGPVAPNTEGVSSFSSFTFVPGRTNNGQGAWLKLINENKIFFPIPATTCPTQRDTFLISVLPTPKVDSIANVKVCPAGAVSAINFTSPITGAAVGYKWTNNNPAIGLAASGTGNISSFTAAATSQTSTITVIPYILKTAADTCFGTARTFTITADLPPAPTTTGSLVVYTGTKTISQLDVTPLAGGTLNYYYTSTGGTALAGTTAVVDDTTYYISQTVNGCESNQRKQIKVNRIANDSIVLCNPATVTALTAAPQTGNTAQWYNVATGGTALAGTTAMPAGQNTFYVEETNPGTTVTLSTYTAPVGDVISQLNAMALTENDSIYYGVFNDSAKIFRANADGSNPTIVSRGLPGESIRYMQFEKDATGRYLLYTKQNQVLRRNLSTGVVTNVWTSPTSPGFNLRQVSRDIANNKLYVSDAENGRIKLVDLATNTAITVDSLAKVQFGASFFTARPFAVCYSAPNTLYFSDFERSKIYRKNIATGVRTDSMTFGQARNIQLLPNGKLLIIGSSIITVNADLTGSTTLVPGLGAAEAVQFNSNGELVYADYRSIKKLTTIQSNRVPVTVIVNPTPTVTATADKVVCNNSTVAAVNFSTSSAGGTVTYSWTNNNTNTGLAASGTGDISSFTAVNNGTAPDTATIIVTPTITNAGVSCVGAKDTFLIKVNPTATVNTVSNQVVCNNGNSTAVSFSSPTTGGTIVYNWTNNTPSIGLAASGTGNIASFVATNATNAPVTATITVTPSYTNGGVTCTGTVQTFTITVNPTATVNAISNQVVCNGDATTAVNFSSPPTAGNFGILSQGGGASIVYNWTNNNTSIGLGANGSGNIASFTATNSGTAPVTATITVTPSYTNAGVTCTGTVQTFTITVNPTATVNAIADTVVCNGSSIASVTPVSPNTGGSIVYVWTNNNTAIGLPAGGVGNVPAFTATNTGTSPVTATITITPTFTNAGVSCTGTAQTYTITVNPTATVNTVSNQVLCNGSATAAINFGNNTTGGTVSYAWTNTNTSVGLGASGSGNIASFTAVNNGTAPATATITVTPTYTNAGVNCQGTSQTFTITVNPTAVVNTISNKVVCNGTPVAAINFSSSANGGTITYNWTNNNTAFGLAASGSGNIASFNAVNNSNAPQTATITVTPVFSNGGVNCTGTSTSFTITVNPEVTVNAIANQVLCNNSTTAAVNFTSPATGGSIVYNWTNSNTAIGLPAGGSGNIASFTATNNTNAPLTATITVIATYSNAGISCSSAPQTFVYTVNPTVTVNAISNQTLCNRSAVTAVNFASATTGGTIVYNWTNNTPSIGLAANGSGNIASFNAINTGFTTVTATITVTPTFSNGSVSCTGTPQSFTITVNPTAVVNTVGNQTVCADVTNNSVSFSSPVAGTIYSWINSNPSIGLAASGTGTVPSFTAVNPSSNAINATITVTPNTAAGCIGQSITYSITVNGKSVAPTSVSNPTPIVCANNAFATLTVNGGALGTGANWKWYADSLNTISIGSGVTLSNIAVAKTSTYFVRAEGTCNNTAAASVVVQRANLVYHARQHWSDVLLFDNSSNNYVAWQWYKNGVAVTGAVLQQYSENTALAGTYYVVATDKNGVQFISCPLTITAGSFTGLRISLFPNPADKGANVTVSTSFNVNELVGASIIITDVFGRVIRQIATVTSNTTIQAPTATGMYIVTLTLQNGMKYSANLLTK